MTASEAESAARNAAARAADAAMTADLAKVRDAYESGREDLAGALTLSYRLGRVSGLTAGIEALNGIFGPEPASLRVKP